MAHRDQVLRVGSHRRLRSRLNATETKLRQLRSAMRGARSDTHRTLIRSRMARVREAFSEYYRESGD
jgi:hypothetical protein